MERRPAPIRNPQSAIRNLVAALLASIPAVSMAQQANVQVPLRTPTDSFFERTGTSWSLGGDNWFFRFGGGPAVPPFGGAQPGAGIGGGAGFAGGGGIGGGLGFMAAQGSRRSNVMQSGNLTLFNGVPGFLGDTSQSPFVTGFIPVVGQGKPPWRLQAEGDIPKQTREAVKTVATEKDEGRVAGHRPADDPGRYSLEELQQKRAVLDTTREKEILDLLSKGRDALAAGKPSVARIYLQMAARRAEGELKQRIDAELKGLDAARPAERP